MQSNNGLSRRVLVIGGASQSGIAIPGAVVIGGQSIAPADYIFIQNDSNTDPASPWYITRVDGTHYTMLHATAPKNAQYIGAFIWNGETNSRGERVGAGVQWESSDPSVVKIGSVTSSGQAYINIAAGTATLTAKYNGMVSTLLITAV
ncbi:hypothetical protein EKL29_21270 [Pantoea sp. YU22]|uniref:hypothetical protein n=1 Tax=Pantoea sp. YU22 TaxID=2497684 RepID=UPI000F8814F8|nr:hypothetical protein [Pantoea sp. YU22]RTY53651.1 hypothetical protein EKL29_21270 [Pantoea sp. YU22]